MMRRVHSRSSSHLRGGACGLPLSILPANVSVVNRNGNSPIVLIMTSTFQASEEAHLAAIDAVVCHASQDLDWSGLGRK